MYIDINVLPKLNLFTSLPTSVAPEMVCAFFSIFMKLISICMDVFPPPLYTWPRATCLNIECFIDWHVYHLCIDIIYIYIYIICRYMDAWTYDKEQPVSAYVGAQLGVPKLYQFLAHQFFIWKDKRKYYSSLLSVN